MSPFYGGTSGGGDNQTVVTITVANSPYTPLVTDETIFVDSTGGAVTVAPGAHAAGKEFHIVDVGGAAVTNNITIDPAGGILINGAATEVINQNRTARHIRTDGTNYFIQ